MSGLIKLPDCRWYKYVDQATQERTPDLDCIGCGSPILDEHQLRICADCTEILVKKGGQCAEAPALL